MEALLNLEKLEERQALVAGLVAQPPMAHLQLQILVAAEEHYSAALVVLAEAA